MNLRTPSTLAALLARLSFPPPVPGADPVWRRAWRLAGAAALAIGLWGAAGLAAAERFPPPDFESSYRLPLTEQPLPRGGWLAGLDAGVLLLGLTAVTWLALRRRSRRGLFWVSVAALTYLGFYRQGCVCPVGAVQNVATALADSSYALPVVVTAFFVLPLLFALQTGRVFCGGVCPLGAIQDLVLLRPRPVPYALAAGLGLLPWAYLGLALLGAATGAGFLVCRYDPFVAFFRRSGSLSMLALGVGLLLISTVYGRPYCRFLCPYGVLLGLFSRLARRPVSVTPDHCIRCGLCAESCPFGAIRRPEPGQARRPALAGWRRAALILLGPLAGAWIGWLGGPGLAHLHPDVRLSRQLVAEQASRVESTLETRTFRETGGVEADLHARAVQHVRRFRVGGLWLGAGLGLVIALQLAGLLRPRRRDDYDADPATCLACGRCFRFCPRERLRLGWTPEPGETSPGGG